MPLPQSLNVAQTQMVAPTITQGGNVSGALFREKSAVEVLTPVLIAGMALAALIAWKKL